MKDVRHLFLYARPKVGVLITAAVILLAVVIIQTQSRAGRNSPPDTRQNGQSQRSEERRIQRDAVRRLSKIVDEAKQIGDPAARVRVMARLADAIWKRDEARARDLFQRSYDDCDLIPLPSVSASPASDLSPQLTCGAVRSEIIRIVTARDPELAHRLVADIAQDNNCSFGPRDRNTYESARAILLTQTALALLPKDPDTVASLGRQSLRDGIVYSFSELLTKLKESNAQLADDLTSAAIARIKSLDVNPLEINTLAGYLLVNDSSPSSEKRPAENRSDEKAAIAASFLDSALAATDRFVNRVERKDEAVAPGADVFSESAPTSEMAASFFVVLTDLLPSFERHHPERLASARALIEKLGHWMNPIERAHMFVFYDNGDTPEGLVAEAETTPEPKSKDELYNLAASLADLKGNSDQALSIAAKISDPERRSDAIDGVWMNRIVKAGNDGKYAEAQELVSKIATPERRLMEMLLIIRRASQTGHRTQITSWLDKTAALLSQSYAAPSPEQAEMLMEIAREYVRADAGRGFTAMRNAIDAINAAAGQPVDADTRRRFGRPVMPTDPLSLFGSEMSAFESLARTDYFRSLQLAKSFNDRSLAIVAQLAVVRTALPTP